MWIPCCGFQTSGTGLRISWQWNLDYRFQSLVGFRIPQAKISRIPETGLRSILLTRRKIGLSVNLQSWTKVLGTVLQYSYFSVISRFPLKTVHPFRNFLAVLPPPTLYKVETRKTSGNTRPTVFVGWGEGLDLCELENAPETQTCPKTFVHACSSNNTNVKTNSDL